MKSTQQRAQEPPRNAGPESAPESPPSPPGKDAVRRGDFWISVLVLIFVLEFFITIVALCYGIIVTPPRREGEMVRIAFPWIGWFAAMLMAPALLLGLVQLLAGGRDARQTRREADWAGRLPERALKLYRLIRDMPLFVVCLAFIALGATLLTIDSALALVKGIALALVPYVPYFIGAFTAFAAVIAALMAWFRYKNNKLLADYAFRREVLEKTGIILVDDAGKALLPPPGWKGEKGADYAIGSISDAMQATDNALPRALPAKALPAAPDEVLPAASGDETDSDPKYTDS